MRHINAHAYNKVAAPGGLACLMANATHTAIMPSAWALTHLVFLFMPSILDKAAKIPFSANSHFKLFHWHQDGRNAAAGVPRSGGFAPAAGGGRIDRRQAEKRGGDGKPRLPLAGWRRGRSRRAVVPYDICRNRRR